MTRKLALTVFAMSLTLVGCGSSSTTKPDVGVDAKVTADVVAPTQDLAPASGPEAGQTPDVAPVDTAIIPPADGPLPDLPVVVVDGGLLDTRPATDVPAVKLDAPDAPAVDAPDAGDGAVRDGAVHDGGTVDGGDAGQLG
jgi:hypothetical protein